MNILFLGEPNDLNSEDCAIVQSTNLYLIDISCSIKSVIICEKKTYKEKSWNTIKYYNQKYWSDPIMIWHKNKKVV